MSPVRHPYIRPLFYCSRPEIADFLNDRKIPYCEDSSNEKIDYLRNRIRLELIPFLREKYNPRITENLFEASGIFRADNDYLKTLEDDPESGGPSQSGGLNQNRFNSSRFLF